MGLSQEICTAYGGIAPVRHQMGTGQSAPDRGQAGGGFRCARREPRFPAQGTSTGFLPPSFAVADSPPFAEDGSPGASGVPRGIDSSLNGMAPAVAVERVASCGQVPVAPFGRETDGLLGITKRSSAPLSGISERSSGLPETLSLESASPREPASPLRLARSDDSGFHGSDLRPLLRRAAAICGIVLFMIGGLGLLASGRFLRCTPYS